MPYQIKKFSILNFFLSPIFFIVLDGQAISKPFQSEEIQELSYREKFCRENFSEAKPEDRILRPARFFKIFQENAHALHELSERLLNPAQFGELNVVSIKTQSYFLKEVSKPRGLNWIIAVGEHPLLVEKFERRVGWAHYKTLQDSYQKDLKRLATIKSTPNLQACLKAFADKHFNLRHFFRQHDFLQEYNIPSQKAYAQILKKKLKQFTRKAKLQWNYVHASDLNILNQILQNKHSENVIILAHASPDGSLLSSLGQILPPEIFNYLPAHIKNVGIYACHPEAVLSRYRLQSFAQDKSLRQLKLGPDEFGPREFILNKNTDDVVAKEQAPLVGIPYFLKNFEARVLQQNVLQQNILNQNILNQNILNQAFSIKKSDVFQNSNQQQATMALCQIKISGLQFKRNQHLQPFSLSLFWGDFFVGSLIDPQDETAFNNKFDASNLETFKDPTFYFKIPCDLLKKAKMNSLQDSPQHLYIENNSLIRPEFENLGQVQISWLNFNEVQKTHQEHFAKVHLLLKKNGSFRALTAQFNDP